MNRVLRLLVIYCVLASQSAVAAEVKGLFETEVMAKSQSRDDKNAAIKAALTVVLQRVLAGNDILTDPVVQKLLDTAPVYVKQFQYAMIDSRNEAHTDKRPVRVLFNEDRLLDLLKSSKLSIWSEIRPETLVWLVVEEEGQRQFFKSDTMPMISQSLNKAARYAGIPIIFPLMDLAEKTQITVGDVLSAYPAQLMTISARYDVVSILAGRLVKKQGCWQAEWALYFDDNVAQWMGSCGSLDEALVGGMSGTYGNLSKYYSVKPGVVNLTTVNVSVMGIRGADDMNRVNRYLTSLPMVKSANWLGVKEGFNTYAVTFEGDRHFFEDILGLGRVLESRGTPGFSGEELIFTLLPKR
ncbi:DUF2066 domain-containing protein [Methylicorpusculum sp.]|uniref:DUF2066 domain-containing protein n=1 Tax=Methylicorpusculum sp. TaxID=2713644 RepID=UPI002734355D|nr:DUF2066 domain-containing protein [Methylicorpusculum sp.]MDP2178052.1 DUF2066 domain-containing protein [Methylicorpusculum sp.]MDP3529054.1 DUF2066 domain-containing protein [Methylicorpusculum sp.]MDZ4150127.1 DUF2066 domain-containing protein [Methylicorpusculum sp.]